MSERELFDAVLDRPPAERGRFLEDACGGDTALRARVEALLARHDEAASFLENPPCLDEETGAYSPITEQAGTVIGPYKLLQKIGEGGFGVVYMAEQEKPVRRMVALKIIKPGMDTAQVIARFESERQALALMDHPNIAKVLDAGATGERRQEAGNSILSPVSCLLSPDPGRPYFVMELVKGVPITEFCDKNRRPAEQRLKLFRDVCHAIQHAHHKGVIHRDIKPSNVMVTLHDGVPMVKVIDFGVAKATVQKLTEKTLFTAYGQMIGTPAYMSPEQAEMSGLDIDTRSDIYSLGVLLYELLTGTTPLGTKRLREAGYAEMQRLIREEEAPRPSTRLSSLGGLATVLASNRGTDPKQLARLLAGDLDWIVMKALEKDRNRRYSTPGNFAEDVDRYLRQEAILARPPSAAYKLRKFAQRNRGMVVTGAVIVLALAGGTIGTTLGMIEANRAEREAADERDRAQRERDAALAARKETFDALTDLTDTTVGDLLSRKAAETPEEREFFKRVVARYERLSAALPDAAEAQNMRARCLKAVGEAYAYLGSYEQALDAYRRAADLYRALQARSPADPVVAGMLVSCLSRIGLTYEHLKHSVDAKRTVNETLVLAEKLHRQFPDDEDITSELAGLYISQYHFEPVFTIVKIVDRITTFKISAEPNALEDINRAIALLEPQVSRGGKGRATLADALARRVKLFWLKLLPLPTDVEKAVEKAQADTERVGQLAEKHKDFDLQYKHCYCLRVLALIFVKAGRPEATVAACQAAASSLERLSAAYPGSAAVRGELKECYQFLQSALRHVGREEEAIRYQRQELALLARDANAGQGSAPLCWEMARTRAMQAMAAAKAGLNAEATEALGHAVRFARQALELAPPSHSADSPDGRRDLWDLAYRCRSIASAAQAVQHWPEAIEFSRRQLEVARAALPSGQPPDTSHHFDVLLDGNRLLATAHAATGSMDQARAAWEEVVRLEAWSNPGAVREDACRDIGKIGDKLAAAGQPADPALVLAPGLAERRRRLVAGPAGEGVRDELRRAYRVLGLVHEQAGRFAPAFEAFNEALAVGSIPKDSPRGVNRDIYWQTLVGRAVCLDALGRDADADADAAWEAFRAFTGQNWLRSRFRAVKLAGNGQPERGIKLADERLREDKGAGKYYDAATVYAAASASPALMSARREELARRALALLDEARAAGFFRDSKQLARAKTDGDLDPLRAREDFKKLLAGLDTNKTKDKQ